MSLNYVYKGAFADDLRDMLLSREIRGYKAHPYDYYAKLFDDFCIESHIRPGPLTLEHFLDWSDYEKRNGRRMAANKTSLFRNFGQYLLATGKQPIVPKVPFDKKYSVREIDLLTESQITMLFKEIDSFVSRKKNELQFEAKEVFPTICRLCYSCGLRPMEVHNLLRKDVNLLTGEILIRDSKNRRDRVVFASDEMRNLLRKYDDKLDTIFPTAQYMFVDENGNQYNSKMMIRWLNRCWQKANPGVPSDELKHLTLYTFRHQFATQKIYEWSQQGHDYVYRMIAYLRLYMGHSSIRSTLYYVHLSPEMTAKVPNWNYSLKKLNLGESYD